VRVEQAIRTRIAGLAAVAAIIGTRAYLLKLPQSPTFPAVRVQLIDRIARPHLRGPAGVSRQRLQVDAFEMERSNQNPYTTVANLMTAIEGDGKGTSASGIKGFAGEIGDVRIQLCDLVDERSPEYLPDEPGIVMMSQDYIVTYQMT
jgi:hypothetical protein